MKSNRGEFTLPAALFAVFLCVIFGGNFVAIKVGLSGIGTFTLAALRFTIASISIALQAKITGQSFIFIVPIAGVILGRFLICEPITYNIVFALALIASGILVVNYKSLNPGSIKCGK